MWIVGFFYILDTPYFHKFYKDFLVLIILHTPLFLIAIDWGRWIHMFLFCLYTVYLSEEKEKAVYLSSLDFVKFVFFNTALYLPHFTKKFDINMIFNNQNDTFRVIEVFTNLYKFGWFKICWLKKWLHKNSTFKEKFWFYLFFLIE